MNKEILVIDDNPDIRFLICNILKENNFSVRSAANYDQAVLEINKKLPDLAIIDIKFVLLNKPRSSSSVSIVPSVLLNPEDSQRIKMLLEVVGKTMNNKCYYIIIKEDDNVNNNMDPDLGRGNVKYF